MSVLGHGLKHVPVRHVPKHVPDRHLPKHVPDRHVLDRHVLELKKIVTFFKNAKTVFCLFKNSVCHSVVRCG